MSDEKCNNGFDYTDSRFLDTVRWLLQQPGQKNISPPSEEPEEDEVARRIRMRIDSRAKQRQAKHKGKS